MTPAEGPRSGRPRDPDVDHSIRQATLALLRTHGPAAVTMEAVASTAGVGKPALYRRYRDRHDLLGSALTYVREAAKALPETGSSATLVDALTGFRHAVEQEVGMGTVAALLVEQGDAEFSATFRKSVLQPRMADLRRLVQAELVDQVSLSKAEAELLVLMLAGSYFSARTVNGTVPSRWAQQAVALLHRLAGAPDKSA